jgi:hypothetical protein
VACVEVFSKGINGLGRYTFRLEEPNKSLDGSDNVDGCKEWCRLSILEHLVIRDIFVINWLRIFGVAIIVIYHKRFAKLKC